MTDEKRYVLLKDSEINPRIAGYYAQMADIRKYLLEIVKDLDEGILDFTLDERTIETVGTQLLHIAGVEWGWIFYDIDKQEMEFDEWKYAFSLSKDVDIPQIKGKKKQYYLDKLNQVRESVYNRLKDFIKIFICKFF